MRDWEAYVRERLPLPPPARARASRVIREISVQLEDFYRDAVERGLNHDEADLEAWASQDFGADRQGQTKGVVEVIL